MSPTVPAANSILRRQWLQACVTIFCGMVISGPILNRLAFGPPKSLKSATVVSNTPVHFAGAYLQRAMHLYKPAWMEGIYMATSSSSSSSPNTASCMVLPSDCNKVKRTSEAGLLGPPLNEPSILFCFALKYICLCSLYSVCWLLAYSSCANVSSR